jgi:hypothetical protein
MNFTGYVRKWSWPNLRYNPTAGLVKAVLVPAAYSLERMGLLLAAHGLHSRLQPRRDYSKPRLKWMK